MAYDSNNIFAKIRRGEIPNKTVFENEFALAFHDINPAAPTHVLVIPQGPYVDLDDFTAHASDAEITGVMRAVGTVARLVDAEHKGFRALVNNGAHSHQEVPHLHFHLLAGRPLGPMLVKRG